MIVPSYSDFPESNEQEQVIVGALFFEGIPTVKEVHRLL